MSERRSDGRSGARGDRPGEGRRRPRVVRVESADAAEHLRFLGSPTVRVDGHDVEAGTADRDDFGLQCRVYSVAGRYHCTGATASIGQHQNEPSLSAWLSAHCVDGHELAPHAARMLAAQKYEAKYEAVEH